MTFQELNQEDIDYLKKIYFDKTLSWDKRMNILTEYLGKSERTVRKWLKKLNFYRKGNELESDQYKEAKKKKIDNAKKRFIISWAQNNTPVNKKFLNNIKVYADFIDASILIIAGRYKNPTSVFTDKEEEFWDDDVLPYLDANRHKLNRYVTIMSDIKIQPTAVNPMSGLTALSGIDSCIFGHPKVHLEVVPMLENYKKKIMVTTGAVTLKNYTDSKSGKKGEFHHTYGFVIVEIGENDIFHIRQVTANDNGTFYDLIYKVSDGKISKIKSIPGIILGDLHLGNEDKIIINQTFNIFKIFKPKNVVIHDIFDGYSISHHDLKNPLKLYYKNTEGKNLLKKEIDYMISFLKDLRKKVKKIIIVRSNHDDFVDRWIINGDWKKDIPNSLEYITYTKILLEGKAKKGIIPYIINQHFKDIITLNRDESYIIKGWEVGQHGDYGINGGKGSINSFRKLNIKMITGHTHTPSRKDGFLSVGTTTLLRLGYNQGPSSWMHSHVIIHENGKAQHIIFNENGEYTTLF